MLHYLMAEFRLQGFIQGSLNIPLYRPIEGWDAYKVARRVGYALFGVMKGTEPNPNFIRGAASATKRLHAHILCLAHFQCLVPWSGQTPGQAVLSGDGTCVACNRFISWRRCQFEMSDHIIFLFCLCTQVLSIMNPTSLLVAKSRQPISIFPSFHTPAGIVDCDCCRRRRCLE